MLTMADIALAQEPRTHLGQILSPAGGIEILVKEATIFNKAETPPFDLTEGTIGLPAMKVLRAHSQLCKLCSPRKWVTL